VLVYSKILRIFELHETEEAIAWKKMHSENLHYLYSSSSFISVMKCINIWAGHVARIGEVGNTNSLKTGREKSAWENNIKMDLKEIALCWCGLYSSASR
jgi:hypothetical protein